MKYEISASRIIHGVSTSGIQGGGGGSYMYSTWNISVCEGKVGKDRCTGEDQGGVTGRSRMKKRIETP